MKHGDKVYRVVRSKEDGRWYFCVYDFIRVVSAVVDITNKRTTECLELAPILTFYNSNYKSHSTFLISRKRDSDLINCWVREWDYISNNEQLAIDVFETFGPGPKIENKNEN